METESLDPYALDARWQPIESRLGQITTPSAQPVHDD
jgi:hypothetical protein